MKKDCTFRKVMEAQKDLKDTEGFDLLESREPAIDKWKYLLNRLFVNYPRRRGLIPTLTARIAFHLNAVNC